MTALEAGVIRSRTAERGRAVDTARHRLLTAGVACSR